MPGHHGLGATAIQRSAVTFRELTDKAKSYLQEDVRNASLGEVWNHLPLFVYMCDRKWVENKDHAALNPVGRADSGAFLPLQPLKQPTRSHACSRK